MVKINYAELTFDHIVAFHQENTIFACCRENGSGKTRLFLAFGEESGHVYTRNGCASSWELLGDYEAANIREQVKTATQSGITVYQLNGKSETVTGKVIPVAG